MRIDFMDMKTGEVYASSTAVRVRNGRLVPDSLGLPVLEETPFEYCQTCGGSGIDPEDGGYECPFCWGKGGA